MNYKLIIKTFTFFLLANVSCQNKIYKQKKQLVYYDFTVNYKIKRLFKDDTLSKNYHIKSYQRNDSLKTFLFAKFYPENKAYFEIQIPDTLFYVDTAQSKVYMKSPRKNSKDLFYRITKMYQLTEQKLKSKNNSRLISNNDTLMEINHDSTAVYKYVFSKAGKLKFVSVFLKFKTYHQYEAYTFNYLKQQSLQNLSLKDTLQNLFKKYKLTDKAEIKRNAFKVKEFTRFPVLKGNVVLNNHNNTT